MVAALRVTMRPASGGSTPATMRRSVDFPLPLTPITPARSPTSMPKVTSVKRGFSSNCFATDSTATRFIRSILTLNRPDRRAPEGITLARHKRQIERQAIDDTLVALSQRMAELVRLCFYRERPQHRVVDECRHGCPLLPLCQAR